MIPAPSRGEEQAAPPPAIAGDAAPSPQAPRERRWYGGPAAVVDALSITSVALSIGAVPGPTLAFGAPFYLLTGPLLHLAKGHGEKALASFGARAGLALIGLLAGEAACPRDCGAGPGIAGLSAGMLAASLVDDLLLAVEYKVPDRVVIAPLLGPATSGLALSLRF
jgi:hypothetical protein